MKTNAVFRTMLAITAAFALVLVPALAFASLSASASADKPSVVAGDTVEVTFTVTGKDMAVAEGTYSYDPAVLTFAESDGSAADGLINMVSLEKGGASTLSSRIKFTAAGAGTADVAFDLEKVLDYGGKDAGSVKADVKIEVAAAPAEPESEPLDYAKDGVAAQGLISEQPMYIWKNLENVTIPSKYSVTELVYHGETVAAVTVSDSDAPTLLYLSDSSGKTGGYYIYNAESDTLYPYKTVSSVSKSYIMLQPDGSVPIPDGFVETSITVGDNEVTAWMSQDAQGDVYLLYGRNPDGETGFYLYNPMDESLQRYAVMPARPVQPTLPPEATPVPPEEETHEAEIPADNNTVSLSRPIFYGICGLTALLLIALAAVLISNAREKARRKRRAEARRVQRQKERQEEEKSQM